MMKRVLDVGNCVPDHASIRGFFQRHFPATEVDQAHDAPTAAAALAARPADLVLVNRKLDQDGTDGLDVIRALKADPRFQSVPMMLVTNYPEYQDEAVAIGCVRGFGKLDLRKPETAAIVAPFVGDA